MSAPWFSDESFNGISDNIFDDVIELLDFPLEPLEEDMEENGEGEDWDAKFQCLDPPPLDVLTGFSSSGHHSRPRNDSAIIRENLPTPFEETSNPDNLPRTTEATSFRNIPHHQNSSDIKHSSLIQTSSPTSVLENITSSALNPKLFYPKISIPGKRARTKRPRHSTINPWPTIIPSFSSPSSTTYQSGSVPFNPQKKIQNPIKQNPKKQLNLLQLPSPTETPKRCMHCEVSKTPQWREGPMGPKTLCNACGVRYRSGRLFPEYRPAASPTFEESVHSNSHRKVMEMRKRMLCRPFLLPL